jgi:hypothetical protein
MPCRSSVGNIPGGLNLPMAPAPGGAAPAGGACNIPPGYGAAPEGVTPGYQVQACGDGRGTFTVYGASDGKVVATRVTAECLAQFGDVTMADPDSAYCSSPPPLPGSDCGISPAYAGKPIIMCPPGNGHGVSYFVDLETGMMAGNNPEIDCADPNIVYRASVTDPRCGGGRRAVPGLFPVDMLACLDRPGFYVLMNSADLSVIERGLTYEQMLAKYDGTRIWLASPNNCTAIPASAQGLVPSGAAAPPAPAPATVPLVQPPGAVAPVPAPPGQPVAPGQAPGQPGTLPTQPIPPGGSPFPSFGTPIGVSPYGQTAAQRGMMPTRKIQTPAFMPPGPIPCTDAPKPMELWVENCPGVRQARGY